MHLFGGSLGRLGSDGISESVNMSDKIIIAHFIKILRNKDCNASLVKLAKVV